MKIILDVSPAVQRHAGVGRYAEELARALMGLDAGDELCLFYVDQMGRVPAPPLDALPHKTTRWPNKVWRTSVLCSTYAHISMDPMLGDGDVFHATDHLLPKLKRMRSAFTLHDIAFLTHPQTHLPGNRWYLKLMMPRFLKSADAVICVSQYTKEEAVRAYGLDRDRFYVIPEGVSARFRPIREPETLAAVRARYGLPETFILFVGTIEPRKNLVTLLEAFRALRSEGRPEKLVVVGRKGWLWEPTFARLKELGLEGEVLFPGLIPDDDLPAFYSLATCFAFPSLYEGFGLPPLEAMACGCPVVCSNTSSLPEVCGDNAILLAPTDVSALVTALRQMLEEPALRGELRGKGLRRAAGYSWERAAQATLDVYREVAEGRFREAN